MTHILIPREPSTALLRPFTGCPEDELPLAWAAMVRIAEVQHARAGSQCLAQIEEPAQPVLYVSPGQLANHSNPEGPESAEAGRYLPARVTPAGKFTQPLYAGAAPAAVAPQGEWRIDTSAGREILVYKNCCVIEDADARYVLSLIAAASQPADVAGPALSLLERQAIEALCAVAVASFHAADDSSDNGNLIEVQRADFEALDAALDLLDELPDDQPGYTMTPGAKAKWSLRRLLDAAPAPEAPESHTQALRAIADWPVTDMLLNMDAANMRGIAQRALSAAPALEAPAAPAGWKLVPEKPTDAMLGAAQKAWIADPLRRSSTLYAAALAAAPQAPAAPVPPAATMFHNAGAIAQCTCGRYTLDRNSLSPRDDRRPVCECGTNHGWSGSFKKPGADSKWHGPAPAPEAAPAAPAVDAEVQRDADHYRFIKRHRLILSGGTQKFGWPIAPFGDECDRYIAQELATERAAQAAAKGEHDAAD